jgi:hypothetical protein
MPTNTTNKGGINLLDGVENLLQSMELRFMLRTLNDISPAGDLKVGKADTRIPYRETRVSRGCCRAIAGGWLL